VSNGTLQLQVTNDGKSRTVRLVITHEDDTLTLDVDGAEFSRALALPGRFFAMARNITHEAQPKPRPKRGA
jgi:hypothetical protein